MLQKMVEWVARITISGFLHFVYNYTPPQSLWFVSQPKVLFVSDCCHLIITNTGVHKS